MYVSFELVEERTCYMTNNSKLYVGTKCNDPKPSMVCDQPLGSLPLSECIEFGVNISIKDPLLTGLTFSPDNHHCFLEFGVKKEHILEAEGFMYCFFEKGEKLLPHIFATHFCHKFLTRAFDPRF